MKNDIELPKLKSDITKTNKKEKTNKMKIKLKKKPIVFLAIFSVLLITVSITYALFFSTASIANRFETMKYDVTLDEEFYDEWGTKKVFISNNEDATPVVVRVSYAEVWSKEVDGELTILTNKINGQDVVTKEWTNVWKNDFIDGNDGWYYYKRVLNSNEKIQILESIEINKEVTDNSQDDYTKYNYELTFSYEAIQATEKAVKELWNKTITISGDNVSW